MKKYLSKSILTILLLVAVIYSCSNSNDDLNTDETSLNEVIFKDLTLKTNVSPNFFDNHFYLIEKLGNNKVRSQIVNEVIENGIELSTIDNKNVKKFYFNNSDILMYSISVRNSENKIIVYKYDDIYQTNLAEYSTKSNLKDFKLKSLDKQLFYSVQLDNENRIGNLKIEKNEKLNSFNNSIYSSHMEKHQIKGFSAKEDECCRNKSGWGDCMDCTAEACGQSWICVAALVVAGPEMLAGFAVSCLGAGPDTFC